MDKGDGKNRMNSTSFKEGQLTGQSERSGVGDDCSIIVLWLSLNLFLKWRLIKCFLAMWWVLQWDFFQLTWCEEVIFDIKPHTIFIVYSSCGLFLGLVLLARSIISSWVC